MVVYIGPSIYCLNFCLHRLRDPANKLATFASRWQKSTAMNRERQRVVPKTHKNGEWTATPQVGPSGSDAESCGAANRLTACPSVTKGVSRGEGARATHATGRLFSWRDIKLPVLIVGDRDLFLFHEAIWLNLFYSKEAYGGHVRHPSVVGSKTRHCLLRDAMQALK